MSGLTEPWTGLCSFMFSWASIFLQEGLAPAAEGIVIFHDHIMILLFGILAFVAYMFFYTGAYGGVDKNLLDAHALELIWTVVPIIILLFIAYPSLYLLYLTEEGGVSPVRVKVYGHQWYWEYESQTLEGGVFSFDSYISSNNSFRFRNLDVDNRLRIPAYTSSLLLVGSSDVLHSWTVPSLGVKVDAVPGRLNYISLAPTSYGVFYGQCRELCGSNHRFIPITVEVISPTHFVSCLESLKAR